MNRQSTPKATETRNVAILFCDLHGLANSSQSASAIDVILFINHYFAEINRIIDAHNGVFNQFTDDTVLAIFGLEAVDHPVELAINAALAVIAHNTRLDMIDSAIFAVGIGIDFKSIQVETIAADLCYEYLVIGDSANLTKHLQALSKQLGYRIILSQAAYNELPEAMSRSFVNLGAHQLINETTSVTVYGNGRNQPPEGE